MTNPAPTIRLTFADVNPNTRDPAAVSALARTTVGALQSQGESLSPDYTGTKDTAEVFQCGARAGHPAGGRVGGVRLGVWLRQAQPTRSLPELVVAN